ncbi:hypothetical protein IscW_ISCW012281 [Ixodes scapularis]|uniref:Uncharacterized protein n=1 Tax=Ixodes scapularis TaxID=6945 RepID=B7QCE0_IXOSC|nr:hypothetical protein IscW_ISCW012281 [Ixodes scapularis]|eukprot:XP_002413204.1 hypothetical protein IscW_ISCW012281 [Ixodes scapularis]
MMSSQRVQSPMEDMGKALERPGLQSLAALLGSQDSPPRLDAPGFLGLGLADRVVPEKHRWRLWLLERLLPSPDEGTCPEPENMGLVGELLASLCLARPWAVWSGLPKAPPGNARLDPFPWRATLEGGLLRRSLAHFPPQGTEENEDAGGAPATATLVGPAWDAALDALAKRCRAFLDGGEMVLCLYVCGLGVVLLAQLWRLNALQQEALFATVLTGQLQGCLQECVSRLAEGRDSLPASAGAPCRQQQQQHLWAELLYGLLSYLEGLPPKEEGRPLWHWLSGTLPRSLGALLLQELPRQDTIGEAVVATGRLSGIALPSDDLLSDGSEDGWEDDRPSCSAARTPGGLSSSQQGGDADFAAAELGAGSSSEDEVPPVALSEEVYSLEELFAAPREVETCPEEAISILLPVFVRVPGGYDSLFAITARKKYKAVDIATKVAIRNDVDGLTHKEVMEKEQAQSMTCLRLALSHHRLLRTAMGQGASAEDDIFDALLSFVAAAKSQLSPWSIQTVRAFWECPFKAACRVSEVEVLAVEGSVKSALLVLRTLFEKPDLLDEEELFALVDALRQLTQAQHRHLEVAAALLDLSSASVLPALDACPAASNSRHCFLVILAAYATLQHDGRFNEGVTQALARLLLECSKGPRRGWVRFTVDGRTFAAPEFARRFLGSGYDSVRSLAAEQVALLLEGRDPASLQSLLPLLTPHLDVDPSKEDERQAGCLVFAVALASAGIALGPSVGGCAVHALVEAVRDRSVPYDMVAKALGLSPDCPGRAWGGAHVAYVVHRWLRQGRPLQNLPFQALGRASAKQFLERHWRTVLSSAVEQCSAPAVSYVSATLGQEAAFLVGECAPTVLSHVMPRLAEGGARAALAARTFLEEQLSPKG